MFTLDSDSTVSTVLEQGPLTAGYSSVRQERFILRDFIRLMTCFVENVKEGEILEGFRIDLPAVVEQILPLLLRWRSTRSRRCSRSRRRSSS